MIKLTAEGLKEQLRINALRSKGAILDLCGGTGSWSKPYRDAGYDVRVLTLPQDIRLLRKPTYPVYGILAAPPCTMFALAGMRWLRHPNDIMDALSIVDACLRFVFSCKPKWWAMENPKGTLIHYIGPPTFKFDPWEFGDPWKKRTYLWGEFNTNLQRKPVKPNPNLGPNRISTYADPDKKAMLRSITPPGFAKAFFEANQ